MQQRKYLNPLDHQKYLFMLIQSDGGIISHSAGSQKRWFSMALTSINGILIINGALHTLKLCADTSLCVALYFNWGTIVLMTKESNWKRELSSAKIKKTNNKPFNLYICMPSTINYLLQGCVLGELICEQSSLRWASKS